MNRLGRKPVSDKAYGDPMVARMLNSVPLPGWKDKEGNVVDGTDFMTQEDINQLDTPLFQNAWQLYCNFKRYGLPHGKGYLAERQIILTLIDILDSAVNETENWQMKNRDMLRNGDN